MADSHRDRSAFSSSVVHVRVGPKEETFAVHKDLFLNQPGYFASCFGGNTVEASKNLVTFEDEDPEVIRRFIIMLDEDETWESLTWAHLCQNYVFADRRIITNYQNACIDAMIKCNAAGGSVPQPEEIEFTLENTLNTPATARIRAFLIDLYAYKADISAILGTGEAVELYSKSFLASVLVAVHKLRIGSRLNEQYDFWPVRCGYHKHSNGERCQSRERETS
ncbi:MAG: hypothetical protein Q9191_007042 [Dirinaria sp. TL-2023a]